MGDDSTSSSFNSDQEDVPQRDEAGSIAPEFKTDSDMGPWESASVVLSKDTDPDRTELSLPIKDKLEFRRHPFLDNPPIMEYVAVGPTNEQNWDHRWNNPMMAMRIMPQTHPFLLQYEARKKDGQNVAESLDKCIKNFKPTSSLDHIAKTDISLIWVANWADTMEGGGRRNDGFGYLLSDGSYGVVFGLNETKYRLHKDGVTNYFLVKRKIAKPDARGLNVQKWNAAAKLCNHMHQIRPFNTGQPRSSTRRCEDLPFPITWTNDWKMIPKEKREYHIIIVLHPAIYQINFEDKSKIVLDYNGGTPMIMHEQDNNTILLTDLETLGQMGYTKELLQKLKIAMRDISKIVDWTPPQGVGGAEVVGAEVDGAEGGAEVGAEVGGEVVGAEAAV